MFSRHTTDVLVYLVSRVIPLDKCNISTPAVRLISNAKIKLRPLQESLRKDAKTVYQ